MTQILKKISVATVCAKPKTFFKTLETETPLMRLIGLARKYDIGQSTYGDYLKFMGEFHATDLTSGEVSVGAVCFLPAPIDSMLKEQIDAMSDGGKKPIEFAFDINVIPDEKTEVGFQYRVKTLGETKQSDPLEALASRYRVVPALANGASSEQPVASQEPEKVLDTVEVLEPKVEPEPSNKAKKK